MEVWDKRRIDAAWKSFNEEERQVYLDVFDFHKPTESVSGEAATRAAIDTIAFREHLRQLRRQDGPIVYKKGKMFPELCAEIVYAVQNNQSRDYWRGWKP